MPELITRREIRRGISRWVLVLGVIIAVPGCHPGNAQAKELRSKCESGEAAACSALGLKLLKGEYVLRDDKRGAVLLTKACDGGIAEGCVRLGVLYQVGTGVTRDSARAIGLLRQGCSNGAMEGCTRLGTR